MQKLKQLNATFKPNGKNGKKESNVGKSSEITANSVRLKKWLQTKNKTAKTANSDLVIKIVQLYTTFLALHAKNIEKTKLKKY